MYIMSDEAKTALEDSLFDNKIFPLCISIFEDKHAKITLNENILFKELAHFFDMHKRIRRWKCILSKNEKENWKKDFIKQIVSCKGISEDKAKIYYNEVFNAHDIAYKKIVWNVWLLNIFFPLVIVLLLCLIIFL